MVLTLITILPLRTSVWESLTPTCRRGGPTNATSYLPITKRYMGCHPQTKRRRETYAMTRSGLPLAATVSTYLRVAALDYMPRSAGRGPSRQVVAYARALLGDFSEGLLGSEKVFIVQGCVGEREIVVELTTNQMARKGYGYSRPHEPYIPFIKPRMQGVKF